MVFYGTRLVGRIDEVPGVCYVATKFAHVLGVPLVPVEATWVVREGTRQFTGRGWRWEGKQLPRVSIRSVLLAYLRSGLVVAAILLTQCSLDRFAHDEDSQTALQLVGAAGLALALAVVFCLGWFTRASRRRADELCRMLELPGAPVTESTIAHP